MERKIVIGLIVSTEYIQQIINVWDIRYIETPMAKLLSGWCIEYFTKYKKAPGPIIEDIYFQKLREGLDQDTAEEIEQDILPSLNEEYVSSDKFNLNYLLDQTFEYFRSQQLKIYTTELKEAVEDGDTAEAEKLALNYKPLQINFGDDLDLSNEVVLTRIEKAFAETDKPLIYYPKQLGKFWNRQLVRGGFVALMASEKRGKSFWLLDMAIRGSRQGSKVAFFQAGDMTEDEQLLRFCSYLTRKPIFDDPHNRKWEYISTPDCIYNQMDSCDLPVRECTFGIIETMEPREAKQQMTFDFLKKAHKDYKNYKPCHNCSRYSQSKMGTPWIKKIPVQDKVTIKEAQDSVSKFFIKNKRTFKLSSHPNGTLSVQHMEVLMDSWEKIDGFIPDIIIVDYADILISDTQEFRHKQNDIWKSLRGLSQKKHALVITATQADADSYEKNRLSMGNFSEDKRKFGHVTAMYGLNQDPKGRDKELGLMRLNELVVRSTAFNNQAEVTVIQNLGISRAFLGSFY